MLNNPIRSDDENAPDLLKEKAEKLRAKQADMRNANKHFREYNTMQGYGETTDEKAEKWDKAIWESFEKKPYASWQLSNNNHNLRSVEQRIKSLERENNSDAEDRHYDTELYGFTVEENKEITRLQLFFDGKPEEKIRSKLKSCGFKWSPTNSAWQRLLNDSARSSLRYFIHFMEQQQKSGGMEM